MRDRPDPADGADIPDVAVIPDAQRLLARLHVVTLAYFTVFGLFLGGLQLFLVRRFDASEATIGLSVGAFFLSAVAMRPELGRQIDRSGRRPYLIGSLILFAVSSLLFLLANSVLVVVLLRLLQGAAGGAFYTTAAAMVVDLAPPERRGGAIARFSLFLYIGIAIGPLLAELLADRVGFSAMWLVAGALSVAGLAVSWNLPETLPADQLGQPSRPRRLVHPAAVAPGLVLLLPCIGFTGLAAFGTLYAESIGLPSGVVYGTLAGTVIAVRLLAGAISDRRGHRRTALPALMAATLAFVLLAWSPNAVAALGAVVLFGCGFGLIVPAMLALGTDDIPSRERGEALATLTALAELGFGAGGYLLGAVAGFGGFGAAYALAAVLCALAVVTLARMRPAVAATVD